MLSHVRFFQTKVDLFAMQAGEAKFCHIPFRKAESTGKCFFEDQGTFAELGGRAGKKISRLQET